MANWWHPGSAKWVALATVVIELVLTIWLWLQSASAMALPAHGGWLAEIRAEWIPRFGVSFHLAMDGISLILVVLTAFLGMVSVACSWTEIQERAGFFYLNLLWTLAGAVGVFLALDLFLFFFFWELMLVPMYFLIGIWGHENRQYAAIKFFIFAEGSGLLMLVAILALVFVHYRGTGVLTFDYFELLNTAMSPSTELWIMLGF
ncbi:MAG TPA: proton-conducting transporter membrane subunit, partial [Nitrosospira sp.]